MAPKPTAPLLVADGVDGPLVDLLPELELFDEELLEDVVELEAEVVVAVLELWATDWEET